jgi:pimeloyl-ACP methyl ester carboxylesterase
VRSPEPAALPLIITHGWPGSVAEFLQVLGPLTDPVRHGGEPADAFHVVAPSIPGFGLSGPTPEVGWTAQRVSAAWSELMRRLGYDRYGAHGGDWGAVISRDIGRLDPEHVLGVHLTMLPSAVPTADLDPASLGDLSDAELDRIRIAQRRRQQVQAEEMGYRIIQSTRPQTLAYALTDSPVGQLGWIVEKFKQWTDSADAPEDAVDRDQLLTNVMLYWLTGTAGSSAALYYEVAHSDNAWGAPEESSATPTGVASFGHDLSIPIRRLAEKGNNIVRWSEFAHGGHFAAMEAPEVLVDDIRALFRGLR